MGLLEHPGQQGWVPYWVWAALFLAWAAAPGFVLAEETERLSITLDSKATAQTLPGLVVLILDHSGSMNKPAPAEFRVRKSGGRFESPTRWQASVADAEKRIDKALELEPGQVDVRVYTFDSVVADYKVFKPLPRLLRSSGSELAKKELARISPPNWETKLYASVRNVAQGLLGDGTLSAYGWIWVVIYSDGDDSVKSQAELGQMCAALSELTKNPQVAIDYLPVGDDIRLFLDSTCGGGLRRTELNDIKPPRVYSLVTSPNPLRLLGGKTGGTLITPLDLAGLSSRDDSLRIELSGQPNGLSGRLDPQENRLLWGLPGDLPDGARFDVVVSARIPESGTAPDQAKWLRATNTVIVPPIAKVPDVSQWGLPGVTDGQGRWTLMVERDQPVVIAPNLPDNAKVTWTVSQGDRSGSAETASAFRKVLPVGRHQIVLTASLPGAEPRSATIVAYVVDPNILIESAANAPRQPVAGVDYPLLARVQGDVPDEVRAKLQSFKGAWRVAGQRAESTGLSVNARFPEAGSMSVDFIAKVDAYNASVRFRGAASKDVKPGFYVEERTKRMVEGEHSAIEVMVSDKSQVSRVDVSIDGGRTWVPTEYRSDGNAKDNQLNVEAATRLFNEDELARATDKASGRITALLRPIRRLDTTGGPTDRDAPENRSREITNVIQRVKPEVEVLFTEPSPLTDGNVVYHGKQTKIAVDVSGQDKALVRQVEFRLGGLDGQKLAEVNKPDGDSWVTSFTPNERMPAQVRLVAQPRSKSGAPLGAPAVLLIKPEGAKPIILLVGKGATNEVISWTGGPENVPTVVARIVNSVTEQTYPESAVGSVKWSASSGLEQAPGSENKQSLAFKPVQRGDAKLLAKMATPSGVNYQDAVLDLKILPQPFDPRNPPTVSVVESGRSRSKSDTTEGKLQVRGSATLDLLFEGHVGAYEARTIELIRGGQSQPLKMEKGIPFPGLQAKWPFIGSSRPVDFRVRVTWTPWGDPKAAPIVTDASFQAIAGPPKLAWIVLPLVTLLLVYVFYRIGINNALLGQEVQWRLKPAFAGGLAPELIGMFNSSARYRIFAKKAYLELPQLYGSAPAGHKWLEDPIFRRERIKYPYNVEEGFEPQPSYDLVGVTTASSGNSPIWKVKPENMGDAAPIYFNVASGEGSGSALMLRCASLILISASIGACLYLLIFYPWLHL
jgi:hypothetical protein